VELGPAAPRCKLKMKIFVKIFKNILIQPREYKFKEELT
jgi:hypothetical protein